MELTDFGRFVKKIANEKRHKTISAKIKQEKSKKIAEISANRKIRQFLQK